MARGKKANKIISKYADLPDIERNPRGWVEATDAITKQRFDPMKPLPFDHDRGRDAQSFMYYDEALRELAEARRMWCSRHLAFSRTLVWCLTEKDLEENWLGKTKEEQEQLIFKSFQKLEAQNTWPIRLCGPDKINCPELCLDALLGAYSREGFLDVVKKFLLDNNDEPPKQPFIVVNERFDRIIGWKPGDSAQMRKATLEGRRLHRTLYIHSIVEVVVALLYDHDPKFITVATEHAKTKETLEQNRDWITAMGIDFDRFSKKEGARRKAQALYCSYCLKPEDKLANGRKMSVCTKCNEFGRQVRYCSRECQKLAWPQHKKECGRAIEVEDVFEEYTPRAKDRATKTRPDIFPPEVGYRRSADLLRLITHLNQEPRKDYVMVLPPERGSTIPDFLGITLDELPASTTFAIMRNRAMCRGDPGAIFYVYRVLQRYSSQEGHESILRAQLKKEYGTTFQGILDQLQKGQMPPGPEKVTKEEVNKMLAILRDMGRFEEEIADFEPTSDGKTQLLGLQVGLTRDLTVVVEWPEKTMPPVITLEVAYMPDGAKATLSRTERRNRQRAAVKGLLTSSASGEASAGPNASTFVTMFSL
ncbi:hypothetical protein FISHEDRAFT_41380 [Fistulina hepatica ATCC 64428]|nr:hypothetical protein FISHEDRAFT_41380 [Fistulina hepatica ATCC 64428]